MRHGLLSLPELTLMFVVLARVFPGQRLHKHGERVQRSANCSLHEGPELFRLRREKRH